MQIEMHSNKNNATCHLQRKQINKLASHVVGVLYGVGVQNETSLVLRQFDRLGSRDPSDPLITFTY